MNLIVLKKRTGGQRFGIVASDIFNQERPGSREDSSFTSGVSSADVFRNLGLFFSFAISNRRSYESEIRLSRGRISVVGNYLSFIRKVK